MLACTIEPLDVISVRDGRHFDASSASLARALWPPTPWTILGALRARMVLALGCDPSQYGRRGSINGSEVPEDLKSCMEVIGRPQDPPKFQLGPVLLRRDDGKVLFKAPLDLFFVEGGEIARLSCEKIENYEDFDWSLRVKRKYVVLPKAQGHPGKEGPPKYLSKAQAEVWLSGGTPSEGEDEPLHMESRIGIALGSKGTILEGMFYQRRCFALDQKWSLLVPIIEPPQGFERFRRSFEGIGELGGDRHLARFSLTRFDWPEPKQRPSGLAVLWFLSPVRRTDVSTKNLTMAAGTRVRMLAVASSKPVSIGGWRMWRDEQGLSRPRPMRRYYPAGTCVFVEGDCSGLHGRSVSADPEERAAGFGVCLCGVWPRH